MICCELQECNNKINSFIKQNLFQILFSLRCEPFTCAPNQQCSKADPSKFSTPQDETCTLKEKPNKPQKEKLWCVKPTRNLGPPDPEWVAPNACCGEKPYNTHKKNCCAGDRLSKEPCNDRLRRRKRDNGGVW